MTSSPMISVCMPVYNAESYVSQSIDSILGQTFRDFEFLIIDDGSTDGSLGILRKYAERDPRIRLVSRSNRGLAATLNELVDQARGEFIARMDADDISLPERFDRQLRYLTDHPECVIVGCPAQVIDSDGDPVCIWFSDAGHEHLDAHNLLGNRGTSLCHPSVMMRRRDLLAVGKYVENVRIGEDLDLFLKLGERGQLANMLEPLIKYRTHGMNYTHTRSNEAYGDLRRVVSEARQRRGLPPESLPGDLPASSNATVTSSHELWAWQALQAGNVATARKHAKRLLAKNPLSLSAWRVLYCTLRAGFGGAARLA